MTEEEQRAAFEQSDMAKFALIAYAHHDTPFNFNSRHYAPATVARIDVYITYVRWTFQHMTERPTRDEIVEMDNRRSALHHAAAQALIADGIVPNEQLGRTFVRLILVDLGLDTYASAQETDIARIERVYRQRP